MRRFSGTTSFEFDIERYKDKQTGALYTKDDPEILDDARFEYVPITLEVDGTYYFEPGRYYGDPYDCYPDDSETEILAAMSSEGKDLQSILTKDEQEAILKEIEYNVKENLDCPEHDYYEE